MLYLCPSPIGNLEDISLRTLRILSESDYIACEDTRVSQKLLNHYDIKKPLISFHKFNEKTKTPSILKLLKEEKSISYLTDAGMPAISDPGLYLIQACIDENIDFEVLPGPSAGLTALVSSGLDTDSFSFIGFLPEKQSKRKKELENIKDIRQTLIIYEAPHRIRQCLTDMYEILGPRKIAICRELTKLYEEIIRTDLEDIVKNLDKLTIKGEFVLVVEKAEEDEHLDINIEEEMADLIQRGESKSQAVKILAKKYNIGKNDLYDISLKL